MKIRELTETDDLQDVLRILKDTWRRYSTDPHGVYGGTVEDLKEWYCKLGNGKGFIVEAGNTVVAFMGVTISKLTRNGIIQCGFVQDFTTEGLQELVNRCARIIVDAGGKKLFKFVSTQFGQVRNREITLWEQIGFLSDEYSSVTTYLNLNQWQEPDRFNSSGIAPTPQMDFHTIQAMLLEDGEDNLAELIGNVYDTKRTPDEIVLTLHDEQTNDISGIAYYRVTLHDRGTSKECFHAYSFGLHFRPKFNISAEERKGSCKLLCCP